MPKLELDPIWTLKLRSRELNIMRAALGGRLKPEQLDEAKALDDDLARQTVNQTRNRMHEIEKLAKNVGEA